MSASPSHFQCLAPELLMRICLLCDKQDLLSVSNTCKSAQSVARSLRWRTLVVKSTNYFGFREWLLLFGHSRPTPLDAFFREIPGLNGTVAIDPIAEAELGRYVRTLVLPAKWEEVTTTFVRILATTKLGQLKTLIFGRNGDSTWYSDMRREWTLPTMDDMMAGVEELTLFNPPRSSLHFILNRAPSSTQKPMYTSIKTIRLKSAPIVDDHWGSPATWDGPTEPDAAAALGNERIFMVAHTLEFDFSDGIRSLLERVYFPELADLAVYTRRNMSYNWTVLERLLGDSSSTLEVFHLCCGSGIDDSSNFKGFACSLVKLNTVVVHWPVVHLLDGFQALFLPGQVDVVVQNYDANTAAEVEYARASPILQSLHWRRVAFTQDPLPDGLGMLFSSACPLSPCSARTAMLSDSLSHLRDHALTLAPASELTYAATPSAIDRRTIKDLDARLHSGLHDCEGELRRLGELQKELAHQLSVTQGLQAPVRLLNDDTLRLVFLFVAQQLEDPFRRSPCFATTICLVSKRWRNVAQSTATLWTYFALRHSRIVFENGSCRRTSPWEHFSTVVHLCALAPVNVRWNWEVELPPLVSFVSHLNNPIRTLELKAQWDSLVALTSPCFDSLRRLKLHLRGDSDRFSLQSLSTLHNLLSLRIVSSDGISLHDKCAAPTIPTLRDLALHASPGPPLAFARNLLANCNLITTLDIRCIFIDGCPARDSPTISLPSLKSLALSESACALLWFTSAPIAQTMRLSTIDDGYVHHSIFAALSTFLRSSRCSLTSLSFISSWCTVVEADFSDCTSRLGNLQELVIDSSWDVPCASPFGGALLSQLSNDLAALPTLRKVSFHGHSIRNHARIASIIDHFLGTRDGGKEGGRRLEYNDGMLAL
ncbi:hypothetical protein EV714DRAFT_221974 [Schizophyllum commune]